MLSLVIVDDERPIIELIKNLIDCPDVEIIGEAQDSVEACTIIEEKHPDLVITDLYMPGMPGITMIEHLKNKFADTEFVIISGHRNFDDAHSALRLGVQEYLLKPIQKDELNKTLQRLIEKKMLASEEERTNQLKDVALKRSKTMVRRQMLARELKSEHPFQMWETLLQGNSPDLFRCAGDTYCALILKCDFAEHIKKNSEQIIQTVLKTSEKIYELLKNDMEDIEYFIEGTRSYFFLNYIKKRFLNKEWKDTIRQFIRIESYKYEFLRLTVAIGTEGNKGESMALSTKTAETALHYRLNENCKNVVDYDLIRLAYGEHQAFLLKNEDLGWLKQCIEAFDTENIKEAIHNLFEFYSAGNTYDLSVSYELADAVMNHSDQFIKSLPIKNECEFPDLEDYIFLTDNAVTVQQIERYTADFVEKIARRYIESKQYEISKPIRIAMQYIQTNYSSEVKLEDIAQAVFLNPSYFSRLFKQQTGLGFAEYVMQVRLEKAKELLRDSFLNIGEIAQMVGYTDLRYFSKLFIKATGVKPVQYRKFYS